MIGDTTPNHPGGGLRALVQARLTALRLTQKAAERRGGLRRGFLGDLLRGQKHTVHADKVEGLALALDVPIARLMSVMSENRAGAQPALDAPELPSGPVDGSRIGLQINDTDRGWIIPRWVLPLDLEARAQELMLLRVGSDAMEPDIARTDVVIIDTGPAKVTGEGIWLLDEGSAQVLRRVILTTREGQPCAILRASNQRYPDHFVSRDEVQIVGRCVGRFTLF